MWSALPFSTSRHMENIFVLIVRVVARLYAVQAAKWRPLVTSGPD